MMSSRFLIMLVAWATVVFVVSCGDHDNKDVTYRLCVDVVYPTGFTPDDVETATLTITNEIGATLQETWTADKPIELVAGTYTVKVKAKVKGENYGFLVGEAMVVLDADKSVCITLAKVQESPLVFKRLYVNGGYEFYMRDSYFEIVNNSDEVQYLDGVIITAPMNNKSPNGWQTSDDFKDYYACGLGCVVMFPGNGNDYPLKPGESVVVANDAANHTELGKENGGDAESPDLSTADWEIYLDYAQDVDYAAPNLHVIFHNNDQMFAFGLGVAGRGYVLARLPQELSVEDFIRADGDYVMTEPNRGNPLVSYLCVRSSWVLDAVETRAFDADDEGYHPLFLANDDMDGIKGNAPYLGKAIQRKVARTVAHRVYYQDTNNSANDFIVGVDAALQW